MVRTLAAVAGALLCSVTSPLPLAAEVQYRFQEKSPGIWELRLGSAVVDEIPVNDLRRITAEDTAGNPAAPALAVDLFGQNWRDAVDAVRRFPAASTEKQLYTAFLKRKYGYQVSAVNAQYGLDASSFTELESADFAGVPRSKLEPDDLEFAAGYFAERLDAVRSGSRSRLILVILPPGTPAALVQAVAETADGFLTRDPGFRSPVRSRPIVLAATKCPAVRPSQFAACAWISEP